MSRKVREGTRTSQRKRWESGNFCFGNDRLTRRNVCCGLTLVGTKPCTDAHSLHPSRMGKRIKNIRVQEFVGWDKDTFQGKAEATSASKAEKWINSLLPLAARCSAVPRKGELIIWNSFLGRQKTSYELRWRKLTLFQLKPVQCSTTEQGWSQPSCPYLTVTMEEDWVISDAITNISSLQRSFR